MTANLKCANARYQPSRSIGTPVRPCQRCAISSGEAKPGSVVTARMIDGISAGVRPTELQHREVGQRVAERRQLPVDTGRANSSLTYSEESRPRKDSRHSAKLSSLSEAGC